MFLLLERLHKRTHTKNKHKRLPDYGEYRILRRAGAVVPFGPRKIASSLTKAFLAIAAAPAKASTKLTSAASAQDAGTVTSAGADAGGGGEGGNGDGDDGGDSDGDGDRPRRSRPHSRTTLTFRATRRSRQQLPPKPDPEHVHSRALNTFLVVTALLLGTALAFGLNGHEGLADKVLGTFVSVAAVATALLRPK